MNQPSDPQWWQPNAGGAQQPWQPEQQATGPHAGQWQQQNAEPGASTGSYTGQWQQASQPGGTGSFSGPWQQPPAPQSPAPQSPAAQPGRQWQPQQAPAPEAGSGTPPRGQQFGGGFQPSQYGGLGAFSAEDGEKPERSKKPLLFGGIAVLVIVAGGVAAWLLGAFRGDVLDQKSLQDGVTRVLNESYGEPDVQNVQCPANQVADNGTTFDCTLQIGGQPKKVTVRVLNDKPEYEVGAPH
ncbi:DUF4333 domain-containing protein [Amycolatopsis samaneae]|uniref:DUF4333 domain-containing protein n=1 Tax=Amycolatopsis samaneae TaxID=664691 RepID=A0ABW5GEL2_9PSEU